MASVKKRDLASKIKSPTKIFTLKIPYKNPKILLKIFLLRMDFSPQTGCFLTEAKKLCMPRQEQNRSTIFVGVDNEFSFNSDVRES